MNHGHTQIGKSRIIAMRGNPQEFMRIKVSAAIIPDT